MGKKTKRFLGFSLGTLGDSILGNMLEGKVILRAGYEKIRQGIVRDGYGSKIDFWFQPILWLILRYNSIIWMNLDLMEFILEIIFWKK